MTSPLTLDVLYGSWLQARRGNSVWVSSTRKGGELGGTDSGLNLPLVVVHMSGSDADSPWLIDADATVTVFAATRDQAFALAAAVDSDFVSAADGVQWMGRSLTFLARRQVFEEIPDQNEQVVSLAAIYACSTQ